MSFWHPMALASGGAFLLLLGYRLLWLHLHPSPTKGLTRVSGRVVGGPAGAQVGQAGFTVEDEGGARWEIRPRSAELRSRRGPTAWHLPRFLCVGDRVVVHGLAASPPLDASTRSWLEALRICVTGWPELRRLRQPTAVAALAAGLSLLHLLSDPVRIEREFAPYRGASEAGEQGEVAPGAEAARLRLDPDGLARLTRPLGEVYSWAGDDTLSRLARRAPRDPEQSLHDYLASEPRVVDQQRRAIYLQPIGPLNFAQAQALHLTADLLARFFGVPVKLAESIPLEVIPEAARRYHPEAGPQLLTTYLLHDLLRSRLPRDAVAYLAVTATDIWPGEGWEAVYGQASPVSRVGVISVFRNGRPELAGAAFRLFLRRTIKLAVHETGHMLSLPHCPSPACIMSGHNDRPEADRRHPVLCPACLAKMLWATRCDPERRYAALIAFAHAHELDAEEALYRRLQLGLLEGE